MSDRIFVKVTGFTDTERHALNSVFRLSEQRTTSYALWTAETPEPPKLLLVDGQSYEARLELAAPADPDRKLIWVGSVAPAIASCTFERPLGGPEIVKAMDTLFAPSGTPAIEIDFDVESGAPPPVPGAPPPKRTLIVDPSAEDRNYLHMKLASLRMPNADLAATGAEAVKLFGEHIYTLVILDLGVPDMEGWQLLREFLAGTGIALGAPYPPQVIVTASPGSIVQKVRAKLAGAKGYLGKPLHPGDLFRLLQDA